MQELPAPADLRVRILDGPTRESPLAGRGALFVPDDRRVLIPADTEEWGRSSDPEPPSLEAAGPRARIAFDPVDTAIGIVTCGGLCPGINDVIRSIVLTAWHEYGARRVVGFRYGFAGMVGDDRHPPLALTPEDVRDLHSLGGTMLGSSRGPRPVAALVDTLERERIDVLFAIGGDGTLKGAAEIIAEIDRRRLRVAVIGIPKTIDNDIRWVERSFGFTTAVNEAARSIVSAHTEARGAWNGIGLVKLMGRHSGFIAAHATLAHSQVNFCLIPEVPFSLDGDGGFLDCLERRLHARHHAVVLVAEGSGQEHLDETTPTYDVSGNRKLGDIGVFLRARIAEHLEGRGIPCTVKYIDPSYLIRSLPANSFDSQLCLTLGQHAVHAGMAGRTAMLVSTWRGRFTHVPLQLVIDGRRVLDSEGVVWQRVLEATGQPRSMLAR